MKLMPKLWPEQALTLPGWFTTGAGLTVMVNTWGVPVQPFSEGVTVMVPVVGLGTAAAVKLRLPVPDASSPIAVLLFVQV